MPSVRYCPSCGAKVEPEGARFCRKCGCRLDQDGVAPLPAVPAGRADEVSVRDSPDAAAGGMAVSVGPSGDAGGHPAESEAPSGSAQANRAASHGPRSRKRLAAIAVSVAVICVSLVVIIAVSVVPRQGGVAESAVNENDGGAQEEAADDSGADGQVEQTAEDTQAAEDTQEAQAADGEGRESDGEGGQDAVDPVLASLDGWWTVAREVSDRSYVYFRDGVAHDFSSVGQQTDTWTPVLGEHLDSSQFGEGGWKVTVAGADGSSFYVLGPGANTLSSCWYDGDRIQYSAGASLVRCGSDGYHDEPGFAASAERALGTGA